MNIKKGKIEHGGGETEKNGGKTTLYFSIFKQKLLSGKY